MNILSISLVAFIEFEIFLYHGSQQLFLGLEKES